MRFVCLSIFLLTRLYIWNNPPTDFTQIIYVYMPYAHLWAEGYIPYLKQVYEYPPLTIPFFYIPHLIDMATNHQWYHINYSDAYKLILTSVDIAIFALIWKTLKKLNTSKTVFITSLLYYSLVTAKANHFIYDSFDLIFAVALMLAVVAPLLWQRRGTFWGWFGFMAGVAIKYVNAPLGLLMVIQQCHSFKKLVVEGLIATLLIWGIPVAVFRSSMMVTFEYHKQRGIQIESIPATLVRTIDQWTHSERAVEVAKAYDIQGPVSTQVGKIFKIIFPVSLLVYVTSAGFYLWKLKYKDTFVPMMWITLGYISLFMIVSPVLSTPYLLWHIPFVALLPTKKLSQKLSLVIPSFIIIAAGMTAIPNVAFGPLTLHIWIGWIKVVGFSWMLWQVYLHLRRAKYTESML